MQSRKVKTDKLIGCSCKYKGSYITMGSGSGAANTASAIPNLQRVGLSHARKKLQAH